MEASSKNTYSPEGSKKRRVLLAEDSLDSTVLMKASLEKVGFEVLTASDGKECIEKFTQSKFELVLLDFMMPKLNGLDVLRIIRQHRPPEELPVIMITAKQKRELVIQAIKYGVSDFLIKPLKITEFANRIDQHLMVLKTEDIQKTLLGLNTPDDTSLPLKIKTILSSHKLNAYPFQHCNVKYCAILEESINPHTIARKCEEEIKKNLTIIGKGGFLWNIVWPIGSKIQFKLPREGSIEDMDLGGISL